MKSVSRHIETMVFQASAMRGALHMHQDFVEKNNERAAKMTIEDALTILEKLENNLIALKNAQQ